MGCTGCSSGRGHYNAGGSTPPGCKSNGACGSGGCNKLNVVDWLGNMDLPSGQRAFDIVEIRFKNSRKEFFRNVNDLPLVIGDVVAVEASPGHDMGVVSLTGELVRLQLKKKGISEKQPEDFKKVYRKAKTQDIEKWQEAQGLEVPTMYKARTFALRHNLQMKISDVEYQGDKTKAIFYYTADGRVDFRELIKTLAEEFKVRIEMRQIGARQEASRLGGIGACGRELCCSTWLTDFRTVTTSAARYQQLSLNPLKLAGQCGKLKCCLNYELDSYLDAIKDFPDVERVKLKSAKGDAVHQKTDIFRRIMWFSYFSDLSVFIPLRVERVKEIMAANAAGQEVPEIEDKTLKAEKATIAAKEPDYENVVGQDSLTRFDNQSKSRQNQHKGRRNGQGAHHGKPNGQHQKSQQTNAGPNQRPQKNATPGDGPKKPHPKPAPQGNQQAKAPQNHPKNNPNQKVHRNKNQQQHGPKKQPPKGNPNQ